MWGGQRVLHRPVSSLRELSDAVESGLPKEALRNVARRVFTGPSEQRAIMQRIVPEATFKRRRDRLSAAESAHRTPGPSDRHGRGHMAGSRGSAAVSHKASSGTARQSATACRVDGTRSAPSGRGNESHPLRAPCVADHSARSGQPIDAAHFRWNRRDAPLFPEACPGRKPTSKSIYLGI
jgi:hypothetical protein